MKDGIKNRENRLTDFYKFSEEHLKTTLKQARENSDHPSAIGGPIETFVKKLLEDKIPKGCKIHPGHIVCGDNPDISGTFYDLVIYRPDICGPLSKMDTFFVFPLECVVGAIEITSNLDETKLKKDINRLNKLRLMKRRYYWLSTGSITHASVYETDIITPRCFMFAAEIKWKNDKTFAKHFQNTLKDTGTNEAHIHAIYTPIACFGVQSRKLSSDPLFTIWREKEYPLLTFINNVEININRFPMEPNINNLYFEENDEKVNGHGQLLLSSPPLLYPQLEKYSMNTGDFEIILPGIDAST